jgi:iron complex outermembrane receptor protein
VKSSLHLQKIGFRKSIVSSLVLAAFVPAMAWAQAANNGPEEVLVVANGKGISRQVETISSVEMSQLPPGSSPLAAVSRLPSVNFQSADTFGAYEWSTRISVRGFNQNYLGFTLDDVPLGDMSYANFNGLHISRAISTENINKVVLSAGTGSLSTASSSNLGGTVQFYSIDPAKKGGLFFNLGTGSFSDQHVFARLETGQTEFGRAYLSVTSQDSNKWKGSGQDRQTQFNFKYVNEIGNSKLTAFANTSDRREIDYQDLSLNMIKQFGYKLDNTYPNVTQALNIAKTQCGNTVNGVPSTYSAACDYQYYAGSGLRQDGLYGASLASNFSNGLKTKATVYSHHDKGDGLWYTPYVASPDGTPQSLRTTEYRLNRDGVVANADYRVANHAVKAAVWYEDNQFNQARRFYATPASSFPSPYDFPSNPFYTQWQHQFGTKTTQFSLEDNWSVTKDLNVNYGFKSLKQSTNDVLQAGSPASYPQGSITSSKPFLPQLGLTYALNDSSELFAGYSKNMRAFQSSVAGPYGTTAAGFNAIRSSLKPETSDTYEGGWRLNSADNQTVIALYNVNFQNRLLSIQQGAGIVGNPSVLGNVGGARMTGLEVSDSWKFAKGYSWFNGVNFNKNTYTSDYVSNGTTYKTNGKTIVDSPTQMWKSIVSYDVNSVFANVGVDYMSKRFYSYSNDASVSGRTLVNGSVGYRFGQYASFSDLTLQLTGSNLTDKRYISTIGSNGFTYSDPTGDAQTVLPGAPRAFFLSLTGKL